MKATAKILTKRPGKKCLAADFDIKEDRMVAVLGSVDSGKSSLVGVMTNPALNLYIDGILNDAAPFPQEVLDDGDGKSRASILQFIHEQTSGRTSSITYNFMTFSESNKIINFVDLAGHEAYLKTTIGGISSSFPDFSLLCVAKSITRMTREHMQLLVILDIPFAIVMSKIDQMPADRLKDLLKRMKALLKSVGKTLYIIKKFDDILICDGYSGIPVFLVSNKSGIGLPLLLNQLNNLPARGDRIMPDAFVVDNRYTIPGYGLVVSGISGINIKKNAEMFIGPFGKDEFVAIKVRTLHDDYKRFVDELMPGKRGCICFKLEPHYRKRIRSGMVVVKHPADVSVIRQFDAEIVVFSGHATTIKPGYNAFINSSSIRGAVRFVNIRKNNSPTSDIIRSGDRSVAKLEFLRNSYCVMPGDKFIFREGRSIGFGKIIDDSGNIQPLTAKN